MPGRLARLRICLWLPVWFAVKIKTYKWGQEVSGRKRLKNWAYKMREKQMFILNCIIIKQWQTENRLVYFCLANSMNSRCTVGKKINYKMETVIKWYVRSYPKYTVCIKLLHTTVAKKWSNPVVANKQYIVGYSSSRSRSITHSIKMGHEPN